MQQVRAKFLSRKDKKNHGAAALAASPVQHAAVRVALCQRAHLGTLQILDANVKVYTLKLKTGMILPLEWTLASFWSSFLTARKVSSPGCCEACRLNLASDMHTRWLAVCWSFSLPGGLHSMARLFCAIEPLLPASCLPASGPQDVLVCSTLELQRGPLQQGRGLGRWALSGLTVVCTK